MKHLIVAIACIGLAGAARAEEFVVSPGDRTLVVFESKAPTETFQGKTKKMQGRITVDPAKLGDSATVRVEVDLASLDTGKKVRNRHMRENHLETAKYPKAIFEGATLISSGDGGLEPGKPRTLQMEGTFSVHGVSRRIRVAVETALRVEGGRRKLWFRTRFPVSLSDYRIPRPEFLFLKLADIQQVRVEGEGVSSGSSPATVGK